MTSKEYVLESMRLQGKTQALAVQASADAMTGTEINANIAFIPNFSDAILVSNMIERSAGFLVQTAIGGCCRLLMPYDSDVYTEEPENYPSLWGFCYTQDPLKAKPYTQSSTSLYMIDDCCLWTDGNVYRSTIDNNSWSPEGLPTGWELVEI